MSYVFLILSGMLGVVSTSAYAFSLGDVAKEFGSGVRFISDGLLFITLVTGVLMILGSFFKYIKYRKNPVEVKFSSVLTMFVSGLVLALLYFIPHF